jgi:hypothetical protein
VWLRGTPLGFPDAAVTIFWGACNVVLVYALLGRVGRWVPMSRGTRLALTIVFGAGTPFWYVTSLGTVWFTAHVCAVTFVCLYAYEVLGRNRAGWAGLWLGLAGLARPTCWFAFPFFATMALASVGKRGWRRKLVHVLVFGTVLIACVGLTLLYNRFRFGNPFDFGYSYVNGAPLLVELQARYGSFDLYFAPRNLGHMLLGPPIVSNEPPWLQPDPVGMSIFLVTPPLLYIFKSVQGLRLRMWSRLLRMAFQSRSTGVWQHILTRFFPITRLVAAAWLSILSVSIPLSLYHNTGSFQFGYRYILDWLPIGLILVAVGMNETMDRWKWGLVGATVAMNLWGALWVYPTFNLRGQVWYVQWVALAERLCSRLGALVQPR